MLGEADAAAGVGAAVARPPQVLPATDVRCQQCVNMRCCDAVAAAGVSGLMDPVQAGLACGSDTAHMSMFGFDPRRYYRGRGAFETMGAGLEMRPGDIAFKVARVPCQPAFHGSLRRRQYPVVGSVPAM